MSSRRHAGGAALTAAAILLVSASFVFRKVNDAVPDPYMDEIFHIPQAQRYCNGDYFTWDPKLTTPPGLTAKLRLINILFAIATLFVYKAILDDLHGKSTRHAGQALVISFFPVAFFFHFVYYTDSGSTFFVLLAYLLGLRERFAFSAVVGSLMFVETAM
ncbi:glucosyltransferase [Borealophlyctis nickersoniae]|nr:glucosyltransferase [Borealophlyctis nickersoniae]